MSHNDIANNAELATASTTIEEKANLSFKHLVDLSPDIIAIINEDLNVVFVSPAIQNILGISPDSLINKSINLIIKPDEVQEFKESIKNLFYKKSQIRLFTRFIHADKREIEVGLVVQDLRSDSNIGGILIHVRDITAYKKIEQDWKNRHLSYREIFENNPYPMMIFHADSLQLLDVNQASVDFYGYSRDEFLSMSLLDIRPEEEKEKLTKSLKKIINQKHFKSGPWIHKRKNNSRVTVDIVSHQVTFSGEKARMVTIYDITESTKAEEALMFERFLWSSFMDHIPFRVYFKDTEHRYTRASTFMARNLGLNNATDIIGKTDTDFFSEKTVKDITHDEAMIIVKKIPLITKEEELVYKDGTKDWVLSTKAPLFDSNGNIVGILGTSRDINERKLAEKELKDREKQFRYLAESIPQLVWTTDGHGKLDYCNQRWFQYTGKDLLQAQRDRWGTNIHHEDRKRIEQLWRKAFATGEEYEVEYRFKRASDGMYRWFLDRAVPLKNLEGNVIKWFGTLTDIHDHKLITEALRSSEEKYRFMAESIPQIVWTASSDGVIDFFNGHWYEYTGLEKPKESKANVKAIVIHPDDIDESRKKWKEATKSGELFQSEYRLLRTDGEYRWHLSRATALKNKDGDVVRWFGTITDIDDNKKAEQQLQNSLHEKEALVKEIHHRVKNNLQVITSLLNLQSSYISDPEALEMLKECQNRVKSMGLIHEKLYESEDLSRIDFAMYVKDVTSNLMRSYGVNSSNIKLELKLEKELTMGMDEAIPCGLIINELISNSLKYAFREGKDGTIMIEMKIRADKRILIVRDNGVGLPADLNFRKTKTLGLQLVNTLTTQLQGEIRLDRKHGTRFRIVF